MKSKKWALGLSLLMLSLLAPAQKRSLTLEMFYYEPYCGGARPSEEILAETKKPHTCAAKKFILISASGKIDTVFSDARGRIKLKLKKGSYRLMEPWRYYKSSPDGSDLKRFERSCLEIEWARALADIDLNGKKGKTKFNYEIIHFCEWAQPCLSETFVPPTRE